MTAAVRLPDQFRPARDTPMAATPTCCCCCCCLSTVITSSIVLPMRVELLARRAPSVPPARVATSKTVAAAAPLGSFVLAVVLGLAFENVAAFFVVWLVGALGSLAFAFAPFGRPLRILALAAAYVVAFWLELLAGLYGILLTAGIGYLVVAAFGGVYVVRLHKRRLAEARPAPPAVEGRPPPVPRPPSSGEPS